MSIGEGTAPVPSVDDLWAWRTDWEDVEVPEMGGRTFRVYALSGTARAVLMPEMAEVADKESKDPATIAAVFRFQTKAVAASLGFPRESWDLAGDALGSNVVERLYEVVARLSGLDGKAQAEARDRLSPRRKAGSGTA